MVPHLWARLLTTGTKIALAVAVPAVLGLSFWAGTVTGSREDPPSLSPTAEDAAEMSALRAELEESRRREEAAKAEIRRLRERVARLGRAADSPRDPAFAAPVAPAGVSKPVAPPPTREDRDAIERDLRGDAGSSAHSDALRDLAEYLVAAVERGDEKAASWAAGRLDNEARSERVTASEAEMLADRFRRLGPGHGARPGIGAAIVGGWAADDRLRGFLENLRSAAEPGVHERLVRILDHHPSVAFAEYAARIVRETDDRGVLKAFLDEDRVAAVAASGRGAAYAAALETRILSGPDLDERDDAVLALALLAARKPDAALAGLRRVAAAEEDEARARKLHAAVDLIERGKATADEMEDLLD